MRSWKVGKFPTVSCVGNQLKRNVSRRISPTQIIAQSSSHETMTQNVTLQSGVLTSPADEMLARAISETLRAPANDRARLFEQFVLEIESYMAAHPEERPWTCTVYKGTDGSRIFRGGLGHSLVIDPYGRLWRARSYEDFQTTYTFSDEKCEIGTLTPLFEQMREYQPR